MHVHIQNINKKVVSLNIACFYIFWIVLLIGKGLGYSSADTSFRIMTWCVIPFAFIKLFLSHWKKRELIACILLNLIGIAVWGSSKSADILLTMITITACKGINLKMLLKISLWIKGTMFVFITTLAISGVIDTEKMYRYKVGSLTTIRYGLGYGQPNATHYTLFLVIALALIVYHKKMKLSHYIILFVYNLFIFHYTDSRTGVIITILGIFLTYIICKKATVLFNVIFGLIAQYSYIVGAIGSFIICFLFAKNEWLQSFGTLSSRFMTGTRVINSNYLSLFGEQNIVTDFGYINILYGSGVVVFLLFVIGLTILVKKMLQNFMYVEALFLMLYAVYTLVESYSVSILMNISLIYLVMVIYPRNKTALKINK